MLCGLGWSHWGVARGRTYGHTHFSRRCSPVLHKSRAVCLRISMLFRSPHEHTSTTQTHTFISREVYTYCVGMCTQNTLMTAEFVYSKKRRTWKCVWSQMFNRAHKLDDFESPDNKLAGLLNYKRIHLTALKCKRAKSEAPHPSVKRRTNGPLTTYIIHEHNMQTNTSIR